jgi:small subunit ribosomal protein S17
MTTVESKTKKKLIQGRVVSKKMSKTATVEVERVFRHPELHKVVKSKRKFHVHDPLDEARVGDVVKFYEGRPMSKIKFMHLDSIVLRSELAIEEGIL